jgi:hypothetical protein
MRANPKSRQRQKIYYIPGNTYQGTKIRVVVDFTVATVNLRTVKY